MQLKKPRQNYASHTAVNIYVHLYACLVLILLILCECIFVSLCASCQEEMNEEYVDRNSFLSTNVVDLPAISNSGTWKHTGVW